MDDTTTKEQEKVPAADEAANNNTDGLAGAPIESEAEESSPETRASELEAELAEYKDRLLRALAETENVRRRAQREREDASKYAVTGFAKDLLSAADNLRRALESLPESEAKDERTRSLLAGGRGYRAGTVGRLRAPRDQAHRSEGRMFRPQFPPGDL